MKCSKVGGFAHTKTFLDSYFGLFFWLFYKVIHFVHEFTRADKTKNKKKSIIVIILIYSY